MNSIDVSFSPSKRSVIRLTFAPTFQLDLTVRTREDWDKHRIVLRQRYLDLIRDQHKPAKHPLDLKVHETVEIAGRYRRLYISYQVEADERAHAYLGIPLELKGKAPAVVALHGTTAEGTKQTVGINVSGHHRHR